MATYDLQRLFELRKTKPHTPRVVFATVFSFGENLGLEDESGILFPIIFSPSVLSSSLVGENIQGSLKPGSLCRVVLQADCVLGLPHSKYSDDTFLFSVSSSENLVSGSRTHLFEPPVELYNWCLAEPHVKKSSRFFRSKLQRQKQIYWNTNLCEKHLRSIFEERGFLHMNSPVLVASGKTEPYLKTFQTKYVDFEGKSFDLELCTSPELSIKKVLSTGICNVFSFAKSFRNCGEISAQHEPEFTMLEWYAANTNVEEQILFTEKIILAVYNILQSAIELPKDNWPVFELPKLFSEHLGFDFSTVECQHSKDFYHSILSSKVLSQEQKLAIGAAVNDSWDELFGKCLLTVVEPILKSAKACFVKDFPVQMAALAAPKKENSKLVNRFECYIAGVPHQ